MTNANISLGHTGVTTFGRSVLYSFRFFAKIVLKFKTENPEDLRDKAIRIRMDATHLMYQSIVPVGVTLVVISNL